MSTPMPRYIDDAGDEPDIDDLETGRWIDQQRGRGETWESIVTDLAVSERLARAAHQQYCAHRDAIAAEQQFPLFPEPSAQQLSLFPL